MSLSLAYAVYTSGVGLHSSVLEGQVGGRALRSMRARRRQAKASIVYIHIHSVSIYVYECIL